MLHLHSEGKKWTIPQGYEQQETTAVWKSARIAAMKTIKPELKKRI
jgi:hypothetical protein